MKRFHACPSSSSSSSQRQRHRPRPLCFFYASLSMLLFTCCTHLQKNCRRCSLNPTDLPLFFLIGRLLRILGPLFFWLESKLCYLCCCCCYFPPSLLFLRFNKRGETVIEFTLHTQNPPSVVFPLPSPLPWANFFFVFWCR